MTEEKKEKEELRIGVFVCHCGINIGGFLDVPAVTEYAKTLPNVVHAERNLYTCADDGLTAIKNAIKSKKLNRVIVASCTPRTHAPLFQAACEEAGLNKYLFEFVNIRDQCSWVHMREPEKATQKAKDLIRMGVARASLLEPQEDVKIGVEKSALVIGGGVAGLTNALSLANQGFQVYLVEKSDKLGGMLNSLNRLYPTGESAADSLKPLVESVMHHKRIKALTSAEVKKVDGYIGNFDVSVSSGGKEEKIKVGTVTVATGAHELEPKGLYGYGKYPNVITQLQLEERFRNKTLDKIKNVVMIQCAGARGQTVSYCSKLCCALAIKNAMLVKELSPDANVYILHNDVRVYGDHFEEHYVKSKDRGVLFIKYSPDRRPEVVADPKDGKLKVKVYHQLLGKELALDAELVVLSAPLMQIPEEVEQLSKMLKVPLGQDKFFFEAHVKLRPVDFASDGIYLCGTARGPCSIPEAVYQALGAASRASIPLARGYAVAEAITSIIDTEQCCGCGVCEEVCPYNAIRVTKTDRGYKAESIAAMCKGCGTCGASCPEKAITMRNYTDRQILSQGKAALKEVE